MSGFAAVVAFHPGSYVGTGLMHCTGSYVSTGLMHWTCPRCDGENSTSVMGTAHYLLCADCRAHVRVCRLPCHRRVVRIWLRSRR